jgi:GNAT superfamily N-acetyltransferase
MPRASSRRNGFLLIPPDEWQQFREHLKRLSDSDRRHRFDPNLGAEDLRMHFATARPVHEIIGWFEDGTVRAAVEIHYRDDRAEAGLTIEEAWRGKGLGTDLVRHAVRRAGSQGVTHLAMPVIRGSKSMTEIVAMLSSPQSFGHWRKVEPIKPDPSLRGWIDFDVSTPADEPASGGFIGGLKALLARLRR